MFTYPLFAFRNLYVQEWILDGSIKTLKEIVDEKINYLKNNKLKHKIKKKGKYIDPNMDDRYNDMIYGYPKSSGEKLEIKREKKKEKHNSARYYI